MKTTKTDESTAALEPRKETTLYSLKWALYLIVVLNLFVWGGYLIGSSISNNYRTATGVCIGKMQALETDRNSKASYSKFIVACRESNGTVFDADVTPAKYASVNVGDTVSIDQVPLNKLGERGTPGLMLIGLIAAVIALFMLIEFIVGMVDEDFDLMRKPSKERVDLKPFLRRFEIS